jgi:radical SAM superfamily enzyme YgiQ (UPF0313 family)
MFAISTDSGIKCMDILDGCIMEILLISPPVFDFYSTSHRMEPLGLQYIKEALLNFGHRVELYDSTASGKVKHKKMPNELEYLLKYYEEDTSPFSLHSGYKRFGDSFSRIIKFINDGNFDIIGISSLFSAYHPDVEDLVKEIKKYSEIPVIIGGTAVTAQKEVLFENSSADFMISGCGTESMPLFADFIAGKLDIEKVPGLIYRKNGNILSNAPSTEPAWSKDIIPERENLRIFRKKKIAKTVLSSGCRNRCSFCSIHRDNKFALREITHIRKEFEYLKNIGTEIIDIEDDDIFSDPHFTEEVLKLLKEFHGSGIQFTAMNGLTAKNILPIADGLIEAGFLKLDLSLVTSSEKAISGMKRPHDLITIEKIVEVVKTRIEVEVFLIPGLPGTTLENTLETMIHLNKLKIKCGLSPLYLVPGVPMFESMGIPENLRLCRGSALYPFDSPERSNIASLLKISRFLNYSLTSASDPDFEENRNYFLKSLERKKWYKRTKTGEWTDSFEFTGDFSGIKM